jgi:hypothetical protein
MLKGLVALMAALVVAGTAQAQEAFLPGVPRQETSHRKLSQADRNVLTDARISMARGLLQLTPEQARFWPPIEEAIRNDAEARYRRIAQNQAMQDHAMANLAGEHEPDPIATLRRRGEALSERGARLKRIAEAWQPLCQTFNPEQKDRMRLVAAHVLHLTGSATRHRAQDAAAVDEGEDE